MITSTSNGKVKELVQLRKKTKLRNQQGVFLVEGIRMFREVEREDVIQVYLSESFYEKEVHKNPVLVAGMPTEILSDTVFAYVSDTKTPQGILCVVRQKRYSIEQILEQKNPHILMLDHLQDPGNLGTIFRTAEAAGVTGIILSADTVDLYNPKVIRSTMGSIYRMPFVYTENLETAICKVKQQGITVYAADLDGANSYDQEDYQKGSAFLIGNEGNGLQKEIADMAERKIRIPMAGAVESLNAAVAAAILMFEVSRQRRGA